MKTIQSSFLINTGKYYEYKDFEDIIFNGFNQELSSEVIESLKILQKKLGITPTNASYQTTQCRNNYQRNSNNHSFKNTNNPIHNPIHNTNHNTNYNVNHNTNDTIEEIKFTKDRKTKEQEGASIDKDIATLKVSLNKISKANFDGQSETILKLFEPYIEETTQCSEFQALEKLTQTIFDISSKNSFLSELNAKLYFLLVQKSPIFLKYLDNFIDNYRGMFMMDNMQVAKNTCESCGATPCKSCLENYQNRLNKVNDQRKAMTNFLVDLMKAGVIRINAIMERLNELFVLFEEWIEVNHRVLEVDELVENIFVLLTKAQNQLKEHKDWDDIYEKKLSVYGEFKVKEKDSLSSRAIFKFRDLLDSL